MTRDCTIDVRFFAPPTDLDGIDLRIAAGETVEITTYRSDEYDLSSRKPSVRFGDSLTGDLSRRDFTVNAMALELTGGGTPTVLPPGDDRSAHQTRAPLRAWSCATSNAKRVLPTHLSWRAFTPRTRFAHGKADAARLAAPPVWLSG